MNKLNVVNLGLTDYKSAWDLQRCIAKLRADDAVPDVLLLTEHNHVYTLGKTSDVNHLLAHDEELKNTGTEVYHIDRGGDITYHGPGQLVGYPILNLNSYYLDIHRYLRDIEEVLIQSLSHFGVDAHRDPEFTGVWAGPDKIAAIGVKVSRWITMHGFALNVNTDLSYFDRIIPCGIFHKGVVSMERILGKQVLLQEVAEIVAQKFGDRFETEIISTTVDDILPPSITQTENTEWLPAVNQ